MIRHQRLLDACEKVSNAALLGQGWPEALESLADAAGSRGVTIIHNHKRKLVAFVSDRNISEPVKAYLQGKAPPNARQNIRHDFNPGFRLDYDDFEAHAIARDPYYQDWLRPLGLQWHANARLMIDGSHEVAISFKRELHHGHYDAEDIKALDAILPSLRASAYIAECVFDAESRGMAKALHQRGRPVLEFDPWARVRRQHGSFDGSVGPITVRNGQAFAVEPQAQADLSAAIENAARLTRRETLVQLTDLNKNRYFFQVVPVQGQARDVFFATAAIGVLIGRAKTHKPPVGTELFGLTPREGQIVGLLCDGLSTPEIAAKLNVVSDTVRFHLKAIFQKTSVRTRSEVVALFGQLLR